MNSNKLDVRVYPIIDPKTSIKAHASVAIDDLVVIRGIRVIEGKNGLFVTMPQSQDKNKKFHDIAFPISGDLRKAINKSILDIYESDCIEPPAEPRESPEMG